MPNLLDYSMDDAGNSLGAGGSSGGSLGSYGSWASGAGSLVAGIGGFISGMSSASKLKDAAKRVNVATAIRLVQQDRLGYQVQGKTQAAIGANGGTVGGSAEDILRMNAMNLALDHGILQATGSERASEFTTAASAASAGAWGDLIGGIVSGAATAASGGAL